MENPTRYKNAIQAFKAKPRQRAWEYLVSVAGFNLTFFARNVDLGYIELGIEEDTSGSLTRTRYSQSAPVTVEMTCSDTEQGELRAWFEAWVALAFPGDGGHAHPDDYVREFVLQPLDTKGALVQKPFRVRLKPTKMTLSFGMDKSENLEVPISLIEHNTGHGSAARVDDTTRGNL